MAEFLDTTAISHKIETLLKSARERVVLISPYFKLRVRIRQLIEDASRRGVAVQIVYGKQERCEEIERLKVIDGVQITFCKNVHAKCYLNEQFGIVTSLNLYDFSEAKNQEMGVLFDLASDAELFRQAFEEAERIIRISAEKPTSNQISSGAILEPRGEYRKLTTAKLAKRLGIVTAVLFDKLIGRGYLELREGGRRYLTPKGKEAGGEFRTGKGKYFLWPTDLQV
jgi:phosphatidylserine/phosphatidylglycerophosphate/cardiolipin synthase-like enzyme